MYRLSSKIIVFLGLAVNAFAQSPHGAQFKINCSDCHTSAGWNIPFDAWDRTGPVFSQTTGWQIGWDTARFSHTKTSFPLTGQHVQVDCRACHASMVFSDAKTECVSCHTDMHNGTVGKDCSRCHNTENWLVDNIPELHQNNGFPLLGAHAFAACADCHKSETALRFERIGNECINCHRSDFAATTNPNHQDAGFSTNCSDCHDITRFDWTTDKVKHDFFPLTKGHDISDCAKCHTNGNYANTPSDCISCHKPDYDGALSPNHQASGFSQTCTDCHTTDPGWMPAQFLQHDADYFPIYSGKHKGEWTLCKDCHPNPSNFTEFTCVSCHKNPETDKDHTGVNGYSYNDPACLACHPTGNTTDIFDHSKTQFPLTGAHLTTDCLECHSAGYAGTPTACVACHTPDYNQSTNPSHTTLSIPTDCATCHTTDGWQPASFPIHNNYYVLNGAHSAIANDCAKCHNGNYNNTPNTCAGCHTPDYNQTTNPNHVDAQFSTDCASCHSETSWTPATFDHNTVYPLNGAHAIIANDCAKCHINGNYSNTPNTCAGCHTPDYNQTTNPNHVAAQFSTNCASCHNETAWAPATFDHNAIYPLNGAHAIIANDCAKCHINGNYSNTPNTCAGCHIPDYNQTTNPNHAAAQFSTDCATCHTETTWVPASFDHDAQYFPIYSGAHKGTWDKCQDCHPNPSNYAEFTCISCHTNPETSNQHTGINGFTYNNAACLACHPIGSATGGFDHSNTNFPLTGAHQTTACVECHANGYAGTPTACASCHTPDYNQSTNPNHVSLSIPTDCAMCHTTDGWQPAGFPIHNNYYVLKDAHAAIANDCAKCHNGNYNNTPNTCAGCHMPEYNQALNPKHAAAGFPTTCDDCHTQKAWSPANFNHDGMYFPIYSGKHKNKWDMCTDCHTTPGNFTSFSCTVCHTNPTTNNHHQGVPGYTYSSPACLQCHPKGN